MTCLSLSRNIHSPGIEVSYTEKLFWNLCSWRNEHYGLAGRVTSEFALVGLGFLAFLESFACRILACVVVKERTQWQNRRMSAGDTFTNCISAIAINLFNQNITSALIDRQVRRDPSLKESYLFLEIIYNRPDVVKLLLEKKWIHLEENHSGCFNVANRYNRSDIVKILLEKDWLLKDLHKVHSNGESDAMNSRLVGKVHLDHLYQLNDYEQDYLKLITLSHWLSLQGDVELHGKDFSLEGVPRISTWMYDSLSKAIGKFIDSDEFKHLKIGREKALILQNALNLAYTEHSAEKIAQRVQERNLCFMKAGSDNHVIGLTFYGNYMAIGNRGVGCHPEYSTLEVFKIDPALFTKEIADEIKSAIKKLKPSDIKEYYYKTLPAKLSPTGQCVKDSLCKEFTSIAPSFSKGGHCGLAGLKAALRFAWAMLSGDLKEARLESKIFTDWTAVEMYESITPKKFSGLKQRKEVMRQAELKTRRKETRLLENRKKCSII